MSVREYNESVNRSIEVISDEQFELEDSYFRESRRRSNSFWDYNHHSRVPAKLSWKQIVTVSLHWRCLTLTVLLTICFSLLVWCRIPNYLREDFSQPCRNGLIWIPSTITIIFYLLYVVECFHCKIHRDLVNIIQSESAQIILNRWINAKPIIRWKAVCYHYGRNIRQRYNGGSNGSQSLPQLQYMRVNSHTTEGRYQPYDCDCLDKSTPLKNIQQYTIIKVEVEKAFSFGCSCSETAYLTQRKAFYERHVTVDDFIELNEMFHLAGSQVPDSLCIINTSSGKLPWYCRKSVFWVLSIFCLSWPLRLIIERKTAYAGVTIHKEFGGRCNGVLATSGPHSISSYDSKNSENIYGIIPSYSEALLLSSYTLNGTRIPSVLPFSSRARISRPGTYETIYNSHDEYLNSNHRRPLKKKTPISKLFSSKTSEDLLCMHSIASGYQCSKPVPRSLSLNSPIQENNEGHQSVPAGSTPGLQTQIQRQGLKHGPRSIHKQHKDCSVVRPYHSTYNMVNTIKQIVASSPRSKTLDETMNLL